MKGLNALRPAASDAPSRPVASIGAGSDAGGFSSVLAAQSGVSASDTAGNDGAGGGQAGTSAGQRGGANTPSPDAPHTVSDATGVPSITPSGAIDAGHTSSPHAQTSTALSVMLALRAAGGDPPGLNGAVAPGVRSATGGQTKGHKAGAGSRAFQPTSPGLLAAMVGAEVASTASAGSATPSTQVTSDNASSATTSDGTGTISGEAPDGASSRVIASVAVSDSVGPASFPALTMPAANTPHPGPGRTNTHHVGPGEVAASAPNTAGQPVAGSALSSKNSASPSAAAAPSPLPNGLALPEASGPATADGGKAKTSAPGASPAELGQDHGTPLAALDAPGGFSLPVSPVHGAASDGAPSLGMPPPGADQLPGIASQLVSVLSPLRVSPGGMQSITLVLHPEALGDVRATVTATGNEVVVRLAASTSAGTEVLRAALPTLHSDLRDVSQRAVVVLTDANPNGGTFGDRNPSADQQPAHHQTSRVAPNGVPDAPPIAAAPVLDAARSATNRLLDIRI